VRKNLEVAQVVAESEKRFSHLHTVDFEGFIGSIFYCNVTKFTPNEALKLIA
jgi:hypothetical protein